MEKQETKNQLQEGQIVLCIVEKIISIWFLIAVFFGTPLMVLGWITQDPDILEMALVNIFLGCPYAIKKVWMDKK